MFSPYILSFVGVSGLAVTLALVVHDSRRLIRRRAVQKKWGRGVVAMLFAALLASFFAGLLIVSPPAQRWMVSNQAVAFVIGGMLVSLDVAITIAWLRRKKFRSLHRATTCPMCLATGTLQKVDGPADHLQIGHMVQCGNMINDRGCDFTVAEQYCSYDKLAFPTLGVPQSGKTLWVSMLYRQLCHGHYYQAISCSKVSSNRTEYMDSVVQTLIESRIVPEATQTDSLPTPLLFDICDNDPLGRSNVLVNLFDYAGEIYSRQETESFQRRRALHSNGFLLFIDPTFPSEPQSQALNAFCEEMRMLTRTRAGNAISTPVAVCVSKIDLLPECETIGNAWQHFYDELKEIDPTGLDTSLQTIRYRSKLLEQWAPRIWPDWSLERRLRELFGTSVAFFPLSPVGLNGIGEHDLTKRVIEPFALVHPLLWLLYQNGYHVFPRPKA